MTYYFYNIITTFCYFILFIRRLKKYELNSHIKYMYLGIVVFYFFLNITFILSYDLLQHN